MHSATSTGAAFVRTCTGLLLAAASIATLPTALAQTMYEWETYEKRVDSARSVVALGTDLFGDSVGLQNGNLSFSVTDVDVPGNNALPVRFTRTYAVENTFAEQNIDMLADWDADVPRLSGVFATEWLAGTSTNRCSSQVPPAVSAEIAHLFPLSSFWQGVNISIPGVVSGEMLVTESATQRPTDGNTWRWTTTDGTVHLYCLSTIKNGSGQGFVAVTADGTRYYFDWMAQRAKPTLRQPTKDTAGAGLLYTLPLRENTLYATLVVDRFGNSVTYTYGNASNQPGKLTRIASSDGRVLDITYGTNNMVSRVTNGTRAWAYGYGTDNAGRLSLRTVTLPDASAWTINFAALSQTPIDNITTEPDRSCMTPQTPQNITYQPEGVVTHPSGAVGKFKVALIEHGRSNVTLSCQNVTTTPAGATPGNNNDPTDDTNLFVISYYDWSLVRKEISGPGISPYVWTYSYSHDIWAHLYAGTTMAYPVCTVGATCYQPACTSDSCAGKSRTTVTDPEGNFERYVFGNSWQYNEGKLLNIVRGRGATTLETLTNGYDLSRAAGWRYPARYGRSLRINVDGFQSEYHRPQLQRTTARQSVNFTWAVANDCGTPSRCLDYFARPTKATLGAATLGTSKNEVFEYFDLFGKWVVGQPKRTVVNGTESVRAVYDSVTAQMLQLYRFNKLQQTLTYNTDGTVATVKDGNNRSTALSQWSRGVPRLITYPDSTTQSAVVNAFGYITSVTDQNGYTTSYGYNNLGRLTAVTPPSGDTVAWSPTTITYTKVATTEYGVGAQHWRRSETRGTYQRHTYYDALWRPVIERELDTANTATQRFRGWKYDSDGRVTFEGYPRTSASSISSFTTGVTSTFDALDRPVTVRQASELGDLTTSYAYLSSFRTQVTPPRGSLARSTISYQAFDTPTTDFPSKIEAPETQLTVITRDPFSRPINITRSGTYAGTAVSATRTYTYHSTGGELCKRTDPETGASFFGYDGASNLLWSAEGTHLTGYNCSSSPPLAERTTRTYDTVNRLKSVTYPSGTNGITYGYKPDGALAWVNTTDGIDWTYEYNRLRLLTSEQTSLEGMTFTHAYTSLGHLSSTRYPHGVTVSYAPNALGQPTRVGSFATAATYHPNGALKSFVYGNLYTRTYSQNARMLVSRIEDKYGTSYLHDFQHVYDQAGNLTSITDGPGIADRTMAYDYLDRLVTANASSLWGLGRYAYDPLDNLREADIGARHYNYNYATNWRLSNIRTDAGTTVWNFGYDVRGNQTSKGSQSYTFDRANRITAIPGLVSTYFYDGHGRRQAEIRPNGAKYTLRTKDGLMRGGPDNMKAAGVWHYYLGSQLVATTTNPHSGATPTTAYQHTDHLGSVIRETNSGRGTISQTYYEPYGQPTNRTVDGPGYTGHVMDAPSGLIYMEQRYYDPLVGRFLAVDPVLVSTRSANNFSRYWYADDNPYRFTDPDGRCSRPTGTRICQAPLDSPARSPIFGNAQRSVNTSTHASTSARIASEAAAKPGVASAHLNQRLTTVTNNPSAPKIRPDVTVRFHDGSIDMYEVRSAGQTNAELVNKLASARATLGVPGRDFVVEPDARPAIAPRTAPAAGALGALGIFHMIFHEYVNYVEGTRQHQHVD